MTKTWSTKSKSKVTETNSLRKKKSGVDQYDYCHDENLKEIVNEGRKKNEDTIRQRYTQSSDTFNRRNMFSNWTTTYGAENTKVMQMKTQYPNVKGEINPLFINKYHQYHVGFFNTEHTKSMGIHGDKPTDKFNQQSRMNDTQTGGKLYSDNYQIGLGTTKASTFIPGYSGHIPINGMEEKGTVSGDPYFNVSKTNHLLNYKVRVPGYKGYVPMNSHNIKGVTRPYCLSTKEETFA